MRKFKTLKLLGTGSFGKVELARHQPSQETVAIKTISKHRLNTNEEIKMVNKEIAVFKALHHRNVVRLFEIVEDDLNLYLVMEYMEKGDLLHHIKHHGSISEEKAVGLTEQLAQAVRYLHEEKGVAHRDIKLPNILLNSADVVKLADFGLSNFYDKASKTLKTSCGSPCYTAPQILKTCRYCPLPADVWSLGVVLYAMIEGSLPFYHESIKDMYKLVVKGNYTPMRKGSLEIQLIVSRIFDVNPESRISISELISSLGALSSKHKQIKQCHSLTIIPGLSTESNKYIENLKCQTITKILKYNGYKQSEIEEALSYRAVHQRALKFNHLNTFIELLQRKTFNKLKNMLTVYCPENTKNQQSLIPDYNKSLQRTQSNFTMDSLQSRNKLQRKQLKSKFVRNCAAKKSQISRKSSLDICLEGHSPSKNQPLFHEKIIRILSHQSLEGCPSPSSRPQLAASSLKTIEPHYIKNNYIRITNPTAIPPGSQSNRLEVIKFNKNVPLAAHVYHKMAVDMNSKRMSSIYRTVTNNSKGDRVPSFLTQRPLSEKKLGGKVEGVEFIY